MVRLSHSGILPARLRHSRLFRSAGGPYDSGRISQWAGTSLRMQKCTLGDRDSGRGPFVNVASIFCRIWLSPHLTKSRQALKTA
jgi:hypothetical protein